MTPSPRLRPAAPLLLLAALLSACGGNDAPRIDIATPSDGLYTVSTGDAARPQVGLLLSAADGSALIALKDDNDQVTQLYQRRAGADWRATPAPGQARQITWLRTDARPGAPLPLAEAAGRYQARLADGTVARFSANAEGVLTALEGPCRISGQLTSSPLPNALQATLQTSACAGWPSTVQGVWVQDSDDAPARFRLLAPGTDQVLDLWLFAH